MFHSRVSRRRICGDKIKDLKRKVDTNCLVSETHQIWKDLLLLDSPNVHWKDLLLLDSPNVHLQYKKSQRKKANVNCK